MSENYDVEANLKEMLARKPAEGKKPEAYPAGTFFGKVEKFKFGKHPFFMDGEDEHGEKIPLLGCELMVHLSGAEEAVMEELKERGVDISRGFMRYWMEFRSDRSSDWKNNQFLQSCGISTEGRTYSETCPELIGKSVILEVTRTNNKKTNEWVNNVKAVKGTEGN